MKPPRAICTAVAITILGISFHYNLRPSRAIAQESTTQQTHGNQSPAIVAQGDVSIVYRELPEDVRTSIYQQNNTMNLLVGRLVEAYEVRNEELISQRAELQKDVKYLQKKVNALEKMVEFLRREQMSSKIPTQTNLSKNDEMKAVEAELRSNQIKLAGKVNRLQDTAAILVKQNSEILQWAKSFQEIKIKIAKLPDNSSQAVLAEKALIEGDLKKAKTLTFGGKSVTFGGKPARW